MSEMFSSREVSELHDMVCGVRSSTEFLCTPILTFPPKIQSSVPELPADVHVRVADFSLICSDN